MSARAPLLLIGAGGHAKVVIELFRAANAHEVVGLVAREPNELPILGVPVLGTDADLARLLARGIRHAFVAIGDNQGRLRMGLRLKEIGFEIPNAVSPSAVVSATAQLGHGIAVMAGAVVNADCTIDDFAIINTCASLDHDCSVAEGVHVAPGCTVAGNVKIGRLAFLGAGVTAIPSVRIGENAIVGAGACVIHDIPRSARARGVPAKILGEAKRR